MLAKMGWRASPVLLLACWFVIPVARAQENDSDVTLRGFITSAADGQPLVGANLLLRGVRGPARRGVATDANGYYRIADLASGRYAVRISYVGYAPYRDTLRLGQDPLVTLSVSLESTEERLDEVLGGAEGGAGKLEAGRQRIQPADIERIPTPGPGGDLSMYLQSLPGVVSLGDRGGRLFIRGGKPSQNLILVDGALIYRPFHILSFFSAFPQELISGVEFYAGGYGAQYTGRISAVIDVSMRGGNTQEFAAAAALGPFLASVRVEGPINEGRSSFLVFLRKSLIETTAPVYLGQEIPLEFSEQIVKVQSGGLTGRCSVTGLHTYDRGKIDFESDDVFKWQNYVLAGQCVNFSDRAPLVTEVDAGFSYFTNTVGSLGDSLLAPDDQRTSDVWRLYTNVDLSYALGRIDLKGGFRVRTRQLGYRLRERFQGFGEAGEGFQITTGVYVGAAVPLFDEAVELQPSVALTVPFEQSPSIEPRLRAFWRPGGSERHEFAAAVGIYRQTLVGITDERDAGSTFVALVPAEDERATALHAILGWSGDLGRYFNVSVEGYYKGLSDVRVPIWDTNARFTTTIDLATGTTYGLDTRVEFQKRPFYLYLGYGYSATEYCLGQKQFGRWFGEPVQCYNPPHDQRHQFNVVASVDLNEWQVSARWQLASGRPYTPPLGFDAWFDLRRLPNVRSQIGSPRFLFERPYGARLPTYHRLDVSVERTFDLRLADLTVEAGAINAYDRENLFYFDLFTLRRVDQLPVVPYLSLLLEIQ